MIGEVQSQKTHGYFSAFEQAISSVVSKASHVAQEAIEYTADALTDWGRGVDCAAQWVGDYSACSSDVKKASERVRGAADRFNLFGAFCEMVSSGKVLVTKPLEGFGDAVESIGSYVGSTADFTGRLSGFKLISLGSAQPIVEGIGALADSSVGLHGIREALKTSELNRSFGSSLIKVAKNVAFVACSVLAGIAACFTSFAAGFTQLPFYILVSATAYLALKVVSCFYDKLMLPSPFEAASRL